MANKRRVNWISQQRVDVPDVRAIESSVSNDFDELIKSFVTGPTQGYVLRGFKISMAGAIGGAASGLQMLVDNGSVFHVSSSQSGTFYLVPTGTLPQQLNSATNTIVDGAFAPSAINYISLEYERYIDDATSSQVYLWNPTTNNETTKIAPRAAILRYRIKITTSTPPSNFLPLAVVTTDSGNNVTRIDDARYLLFSQGKGGFNPDPFNKFVFPEGRSPNPSFSTSNSVSPFEGGDKAIGTLKDWMLAVTTEIQAIKGTTYWSSASSSGSLESLRQDLGNTLITGRGTITHSEDTAGLLNWSDDIVIKVIGSRLSYTLEANPTSTDVTLTEDEVAYINLVRGVVIVPNLVYTNGSAIVTSVGAIAWTALLQPGDFIKLGSETDAFYYKILTVNSLTQVTMTENYGPASTGPSGAKSKYAFGAYQSSPAPSGLRDIYIAPRKDVPPGENVFWLYTRSDNGGAIPRVYVRFLGSELEQGETEDISDNVPLQLLMYIGSPLESASKPQYTSALNPGALPEITDITTVVANSMVSNHYFYINSSGNSRKYYVWINRDGIGVDPAPPSAAPIEWIVSSGDTSIVTAQALRNALNATIFKDFKAIQKPTPNANTVRVTNASAGACSDVVEFNSGVTIALIQNGVGVGTAVVQDGDNLTLAIAKLDQAIDVINTALDEPSYDEPIDVVGSATPVLVQNNTYDGNPVAFNSSVNDQWRVAEAFVFSSAQSLNEVHFWLVLLGGVEVFVNICADAAGEPGTILATSVNSVNAGTYTPGEQTFTFTGFSAAASTQYWAVLTVAPGTSGQVRFQGSATGSGALPLASANAGSSWFGGFFTSPYLQIAIYGAGALPSGEILGPVISGTEIFLPNNSRMGNVVQKYTVGKGTLVAYLNGQFLRLGTDYSEVGIAGTPSNSITILQGLPVGDTLELRISGLGAGNSGGGGGEGPPGPPGPSGPPGADAIGGPVAISNLQSNYTAMLSDNVLLGDASGGSITLTLPAAASAPGQVFFLKKIDASANTVTVKANGSELIDGANTIVINSQYVAVTVVSNGTQYYAI